MSTDHSRELRNALGQFATGITVVTAINNEGQPVGMTANSFSSVSLEPPLVLWCIGHEATLYSVFQQADRFAINVLGQQAEGLSNTFASPFNANFDEANWQASNSGLPVLNEAIAVLQCKLEHRYPGGDHDILVGRVVDFSYDDQQAPLIFHQGAYRSLK